MSKKTRTPEEKAAKEAARKERDTKRLAAVEAKTKARKEAEEKGLPWNDTIVAARFLEDYDAAFMSAVAGSPKVDDEPAVSPTKEELEAIAKGPQNPTPTAAELVKMAKAAVGRTTEEETANDNTEEPEAPTATGVDVVAKENPESDTPAQEAPVVEESADNSYDADNPATWLTDTNGGLLRLPSESNNKYNKRKNLFRNWKKAQAALDTETVGRNDDVPETKSYPTGELRYNSDEDGQTLPVPTKSAKEAAAVFEAATETETNEPATEAPAEPTSEPAQADPVEEAGTVGNEDDKPAETPEPTLPVEPVGDTAQTTVAKPTLKLATSQTEDEALVHCAQKFYGDTWTAERAEKLTKAFKFLEMAIRLQQKGESDSRVNMPMTSAIRLETEALGIAVTMAKAA